MKKNTSLLAGLLIIAAFSILTLAGCKKDSDGDLTTDIVGHYASGTGSDHVDITVTKIDNNTISVNFDGAYNNVVYALTKMNSKTTFTLNKVTRTDYYNYVQASYEFSGTGSYSANNITLIEHQKVTDMQNNVLYDGDYSYSATRQ